MTGSLDEGNKIRSRVDQTGKETFYVEIISCPLNEDNHKHWSKTPSYDPGPLRKNPITLGTFPCPYMPIVRLPKKYNGIQQL
jgi:hypothetical protein